MEEDIWILSRNNYDTEQCNPNQKLNLMLCDDTNDRSSIEDSARLTECSSYRWEF